MTDLVAHIVIIALDLYLVVGVIFYFPFMKKGVHKIDDGVKAAPLFMKILIFPGTVALWPLLLKKVRKGEKS